MIQMKGKHTLTIKKGQIVHPVPVLHHALCMDGRRVTRVSGNRIYYKSDNVEYYMKLNCVMFVCDTVEESVHLENLSRQQRTHIMNYIDQHTRYIQQVLMHIIADANEQDEAA